MNRDRCHFTGLIAFLSVLVAIVLLSKIGGNGADLAIMTALVSVLGMLAPGLVPSRGNERTPQKVEVANAADNPVPVEPK